VKRFVLLRHLIAIVILPVTVTALVPSWIAQRYHVVLRAGVSAPAILLQATGVAAALLGRVSRSGRWIGVFVGRYREGTPLWCLVSARSIA
jgi:hypothetical protein